MSIPIMTPLLRFRRWFLKKIEALFLKVLLLAREMGHLISRWLISNRSFDAF
jgi:hypothetical protein